MTSQRPPSLLVETLCAADAVYGTIIDLNKLALDGRQADALHRLALLAAAVEAHRPVISGVITAQRQAAEHLDLAQRPNVRVLASIGIAQPQPDPANSEHAPTPEQPSPSVA